MKFEVKKKYVKKTKILYDEEGYFDSNISINTDINILIAYINIGIDSENMEIKSIWGYSPRMTWVKRSLKIPSAEEGCVHLLGDYEPGLTFRLDRNDKWKAFVDEKKKWFCIGNPNTNGQDISVKINENTIIVITELGELKAIYINLICNNLL